MQRQSGWLNDAEWNRMTERGVLKIIWDNNVGELILPFGNLFKKVKIAAINF